MRIEIVPIFSDINVVVGNFDTGDRNSCGCRRWRRNFRGSCYYLTVIIWWIRVIVVCRMMRIEIIPFICGNNFVVGIFDAGDRNSYCLMRGRRDCRRSCYYLTMIILYIRVIVVFATMRIKIIRNINTVVCNINAGVIRKIIVYSRIIISWFFRWYRITAYVR